MPQAAQQDNLNISVETLGTFSDAQKAKLVQCYKLGTILDVVQVAPTGVSRCISASYEDVESTRTYTFVFGGDSLQTVTVEESIGE